jgi:hypothetical protein
MSDPNALRARARALATAALRCRTLADDIELRRLLLAGRINEVRSRHTPEVWNSSAADASREVVTRHLAPALVHLGVDLATTVRLLRGQGLDLATRSDRLVTEAIELETAMPDPTEAVPQ